MTSHVLYTDASSKNFHNNYLSWSSYLLLWAMYNRDLNPDYLREIKKKFGTLKIRDYSRTFFEYNPEAKRYDLNIQDIDVKPKEDESEEDENEEEVASTIAKPRLLMKSNPLTDINKTSRRLTPSGRFRSPSPIIQAAIWSVKHPHLTNKVATLMNPNLLPQLLGSHPHQAFARLPRKVNRWPRCLPKRNRRRVSKRIS